MSARNPSVMNYGRCPVSLESHSRAPFGSSSASYSAPIRMFPDPDSSGLDERSHLLARNRASQGHPEYIGGGRLPLPYEGLESAFIPGGPFATEEGNTIARGLPPYAPIEPQFHSTQVGNNAGVDHRRSHDHHSQTRHAARSSHLRQNHLRSSRGGDVAGLGLQDYGNCDDSSLRQPQRYMGEEIASRSMSSLSDMTGKIPFEMGVQSADEFRGGYPGLDGGKQQLSFAQKQKPLQPGLVGPGRSSHHLPRVVENVRVGGGRPWSPPLLAMPVAAGQRPEEFLAISPTGLRRDDVPPLMMSPLRREDIPGMMSPPRHRDASSRQMMMGSPRRKELHYTISPPPALRERSRTPSPRRRVGGYPKLPDYGERQRQQPPGRRLSPPPPLPLPAEEFSMMREMNFPVVSPRRGAPLTSPRSPRLRDGWKYDSLRFNSSPPPPPPPPPPLTMPMSPRWDFPSRSLLWGRSPLEDCPTAVSQWDLRDLPPGYHSIGAGEVPTRKMGRHDDVYPRHPDQIPILSGLEVEGPSQVPGLGWAASTRRREDWWNGEGLAAVGTERWLPHLGGWDHGAYRSATAAHAHAVKSHAIINPRTGGEYGSKFVGRGRGRSARVVEKGCSRGEQQHNAKGSSKEKSPGGEHHNKKKDSLEAAIERCKADDLKDANERKISKSIGEGNGHSPASAPEQGGKGNPNETIRGGTENANEKVKCSTANLEVEASISTNEGKAVGGDCGSSQIALSDDKPEEAEGTDTIAVSMSKAGTEQTEQKVAISDLKREDSKNEAAPPVQVKGPEGGSMASESEVTTSTAAETDEKGAAGPKRTSLVMEIERAQKSRRLAVEQQQLRATNHDGSTDKSLPAGKRLSKLNRAGGIPPYAARRTGNEDNFLKRRRQTDGQGGSYRLVSGK